MWRKSPPCSIELLAVFLLVSTPGWAADPVPAAGETARSVLADPRYQRELPLPRPSPLLPPSPRPRPDVPDGGRDPERGRDLGGRPSAPAAPGGGRGSGGRAPVLPSSGSARFGFLVFAVLAAAALLLLALRIFQGWRRRERPAGPARVRKTAAEEPAGRPVGEADRLAAEGRYAEAVHVLLLQTLRQLADRFRVPLQPSRTSREILHLLPLKADRREVLGDLVRMVERSLFGGATLGLADYEKGLGLARVVLGPGGAA